MTAINKISLSEVFLGKGALIICNKCTEKNPCRSVISKWLAIRVITCLFVSKKHFQVSISSFNLSLLFKMIIRFIFLNTNRFYFEILFKSNIIFKMQIIFTFKFKSKVGKVTFVCKNQLDSDGSVYAICQANNQTGTN